MVNLQKVRINQFLKEREGRYRPNDEAVRSLKRLDKIDFSGNIYLSDKESKTDMVIIEPGDLVISGINVSKGAIAVYYGKEPITATIHYSSYVFDKNQVDISYFKRFIKSQSFVQALKNQVKGGIKTEIKPKHILPLEILLPDINKQKGIVAFFESIENKIASISNNNNQQQAFVINLRQQVLQEAVEGKLTTKWRKEHPDLISGDNHASKLLENIKEGKKRLISEGKIKKGKPASLNSDNEKPFELPEGWVWCKLGDLLIYADNLDIHKKLKPDTLINYVDIDSIDNKNHKIGQIKTKKVSELSSRARRVLKKGYIVYSTVRPYLENIAFIEEDIDNLIGSTGFNVFKTVCINQEFIFYLLLSPYINELYREMMIGFNSPSITNEQFEKTMIPIPPIEEEQAIVERIKTLIATLEELEKQVLERKNLSEMLTQSVLREAFANSD